MGSMTVKQVVQSYIDAPAALTSPTKGGTGFSHDGLTAYSYGAVIARKLGDKRAEVTSAKWSATTSKHTSLIEVALLRAGYTLSKAEL